MEAVTKATERRFRWPKTRYRHCSGLATKLTKLRYGSSASDDEVDRRISDGLGCRRPLRGGLWTKERSERQPPATAIANAAGTRASVPSRWSFRDFARSSYFPEWLLAPRRRAEMALVQVVSESYVNAVSTRRVDRLTAAMGIEGISKSQVSEMAKSLNEI